MDLPNALQRALARFEAAGFAAYLVGGCVRDAQRGLPPTDFDLCTEARPEEVARLFSDARVIETGLAHGTLTVLLDGLPLEITSFRTEGGYSDGRRPDRVSFGASLAEDLARRDFTINAMAWNPREGLIDHASGLMDLQKGCIRCVGVADQRFSEDALRILRALRFAATLDFEIEAETQAALVRSKGRLPSLAAERVRVELEKLLCGRAAAPVLRDYLGVLGELLPELLSLRDFAQNKGKHCPDLLIHTLLTVQSCPQEPILRWAALLHALGKPACYSEGARGEGHFQDHAAQSEILADGILRRLRLDNKSRSAICELITLYDLSLRGELRQTRRLLCYWGEERLSQLLQLKRADRLAGSPSRYPYLTDLDLVLQQMKQLLEEEGRLSLRGLAVKGADLLDLGYQGPTLGAALGQLLEAVLEGEVANERAALLLYLEGSCNEK